MPPGIYPRIKHWKVKDPSKMGLYWKGKKLSKEHKIKIGLKSLGKQPMLGKKHSLKTILLFREQRKKWWDDPEFRKKSLENRVKMFGNKNPMWKGGITPIIMRVRQSESYNKWRLTVYKKDKFKCQACGYQHQKGKKRKVLDADHIIPFSFIFNKLLKEKGEINLYENALNYEPLWDIENGRVLCRSCHKKTDTFLNRWHKKYYELSK